MSAKTHKAAHRVRAKIMRVLGEQCAGCGSFDDLTLDCIEPRGHDHHSAGFIGRQWFYLKELRAGNIQILCETCQTWKADHSQAEFLEWLTTKLGSESIPIRIKLREQGQQNRNAVTSRELGGWSR